MKYQSENLKKIETKLCKQVFIYGTMELFCCSHRIANVYTFPQMKSPIFESPVIYFEILCSYRRYNCTAASSFIFLEE